MRSIVQQYLQNEFYIQIYLTNSVFSIVPLENEENLKNNRSQRNKNMQERNFALNIYQFFKQQNFLKQQECRPQQQNKQLITTTTNCINSERTNKEFSSQSNSQNRNDDLIKMKINSEKIGRSKYKRISSNERALIIHYLEHYKYSTSHVSMITGHNASTIKAIYQVFKREGRIKKKEKRDQILNLKRKFVVVLVDDTNMNKICVDSHDVEDQVLKETELHLEESTDAAILTLLEKNKFKLMSLLENKEKIDTFQSELKAIRKHKCPSHLFEQLVFSPEQKSSLKKEEMFLKKESTLNLSLFNENSEPFTLNNIINVLEEQYRMMAE